MVDEARRGLTPGVRRVQAPLIGQDDQRVSVHQVGHQRAQGVVIAELDLVIDDGVVLVDDRDDLELQQGQQGGAGIEVALAVGQVRVGQEHLRAGHAVAAQLRLVHLHQAHLADGSSSLQLVQLFGACRPTQALHALGDGATGHHHHLTPTLGQSRQLTRPVTDRFGIHAAPLVGHEAGADLDDDAPRAGQGPCHVQLRLRSVRTLSGSERDEDDAATATVPSAKGAPKRTSGASEATRRMAATCW